jgi:hypothetical protein
MHIAATAIKMTPRTAIWVIEMLFYALLDVMRRGVSCPFLVA